jgi:hypothetical protein
MKNILLLSFTFLLSTSLFAQIDYATEIAPIFTNNCNSCHAGGGNGFDSSPYDDLIASSSTNYDSKHILAGNPDNSPLVDKIEANPQFGSRMPQGGSLSSDEISKIRQWIQEGANEEVATSSVNEIYQPDSFELLGNYPNPFNPTTTIQFQLSESADFQITIYNANGQLVQTIDGRAGVGVRDQSVDLTDQASGVYFYRVRATTSSFSALIGSGKMTLVK